MFREVFRLNPTVPPGYGYTKAVDIWSIGVIAAMLLSGESIFGNFLDPTREDFDYEVAQAAAECDLRVLDWGQAWKPVSSRPKDLIRKLLELDEKSRLTAKEALEHIWFTAPEYRAELDALFQETIKDWQPRRKVFRLMEKLDLELFKSAELLKGAKPNISTSSKSPYFDLQKSPPRRILPTKRRLPARRVATRLPRINEETTAELLHASLRYQGDASSIDRPRASTTGADIDVEHGFSDLDIEHQASPHIEVQMTDYEDSSEQHSQGLCVVSESPPVQKRKLLFEGEDLTDDESPIRAGTRRRLQSAPKRPRHN